ncbi:MAG TPA: hypothetical protein VNL71_13075 [Chloroflexota bacterium]|nr:hypothetical protein [Chloroflexota bacterium]
MSDDTGAGPPLPPDLYFGQNDPINGTYELQVIGTGTGPYTLDFFAIGAGGGTSLQTLAGTTATGQIDTYNITISRTSGQPPVVQRIGDSTPPTTVVSATLGSTSTAYPFATWTNQPVQVTLAAADNPGGSGVAHTYYAVDNPACTPTALASCTVYSGSPFPVSAEGNHELTYFSVDSAGNAEAAKIAVIQIDTTPPTTTASATLGSTTNPYTFATWTNQPVQVTLSATDNSGGSGIARIYYSLDSSPCTPATLASCTLYAGSPFNITAEGTHTLTYMSVDSAGNVEVFKTVTIQIDQTPPNPPPGAVNPAPNPAGWNNTPATVSFTSNGDAGAPAAQSGVVSCTAPTTISSETAGATVSGTCTDAAGNTSAATTVTVKLDTTKPHTTAALVPAPNAAGWNNGPVQVTLSATDAGSGVQTLYYAATGAQTIATTNVAGSTATLNITSEGQTGIIYSAMDAAYNLEAAEFINVKIDHTAPSCALTGTGVNGSGQKYIQITVQDGGSGIGGIVTTTLNNATMPTTFTSGATSPVVLTATKIDQSQGAQVGLQITDLAGNVTNCDPVLTDLIRDSHKPSTIRAAGIAQGEHLLHIYNGDPGLSHLIIRVNGVKILERDLEPNEQRTVDIASALQPGDHNRVTVIARGKQRGEATLVIADS